MAKLKVFREGKEIQTLNMSEGQEYYAGRSEHAHIRLPDPSISRQHLKFTFENGQWQVYIISRFGYLTHGGQNHQSLILENGIGFHSGGYDFKFEDTAVGKPVSEKSLTPDHGEPQIPVPVNHPPSTPYVEMDEKTSVGSILGVGYLRITNSETGKVKAVKLDGQFWKVGRAPDCQVVLEEGAASRNHFEVMKTSSGFHIKDLGSSNGTQVNGQLLEEKVPFPLNSGDVITIGGTTIEFEIRDPQFEARLKESPLIVLPAQHGRGVEKISPKKKLTQQQIRIWIGALFFIIIVAALTETEEEAGQTQMALEQAPSAATAPAPQTSAHDRLTPQQKNLIRDTYNLADSLYKKGKYEAALIEIRKIHDLVPYYKNSKELEVYCQQAIDIQNQQREIDLLREKEQNIKRQVQDIIDDCKRRLGSKGSVVALEGCLSPAFELDPENAQAKSLVVAAQREEAERQAKKANEQAYQASLKQSAQLYSKAKSLEAKKKWLDAISAYNEFIESPLPDPGNNKAKAKSALERIKVNIEKEITNREQTATELYVKEKHREALETLERALELDPANIKIKTLFDKIYNDLRKRLKALYDDSVLEESLGNIEAAKQKWESIVQQDAKEGEYAQKARRKLKRYGN